MSNNDALYVSSVAGKLCTRWGGGKSGGYIGATKSMVPPYAVSWDTSAIVPIPMSEFKKYRREYNRAISEGALALKTLEQYEAHLAGEEI